MDLWITAERRAKGSINVSLVQVRADADGPPPCETCQWQYKGIHQWTFVWSGRWHDQRLAGFDWQVAAVIMHVKGSFTLLIQFTSKEMSQGREDEAAREGEKTPKSSWSLAWSWMPWQNLGASVVGSMEVPLLPLQRIAQQVSAVVYIPQVDGDLNDYCERSYLKLQRTGCWLGLSPSLFLCLKT